jgi:hypothetical protein
MANVASIAFIVDFQFVHESLQWPVPVSLEIDNKDAALRYSRRERPDARRGMVGVWASLKKIGVSWQIFFALRRRTVRRLRYGRWHGRAVRRPCTLIQIQLDSSAEGFGLKVKAIHRLTSSEHLYPTGTADHQRPIGVLGSSNQVLVRTAFGQIGWELGAQLRQSLRIAD